MEDRNEAEAVARRQALKRSGIEPSGNGSVAAEMDAVLKDFGFERKDLDLKTVELSTGKRFVVQPLAPGHYFEAIGSPLLEYAGEGKEGREGREGGNEDALRWARFLVCSAVVRYKDTRVRLVSKQQWECVGNELSAHLLTLGELFELANAVDRPVEEEAAAAAQFPEAESDGGGSVESVEDSSDVQELREAAE